MKNTAHRPKSGPLHVDATARAKLESLASLLEPGSVPPPPMPSGHDARGELAERGIPSGIRPVAAIAATPVAKGAPRSYAMWITAVLVLALTVALAARGYGYYILDAEARLDHPEHRILSSTGFLGQGYGVVGTGLIVLNLLYLVRRMLAKWALGSMTVWLNIHVFTGLTGSVLILFHSAFHLRTTIAIVTAASLAVVVATGLVGRYLYALRPTGTMTLEQRLEELAPIFPEFVSSVRTILAQSKLKAVPADPSLFTVLFMIPRWLVEARYRRRAVRVAAKADAKVQRLKEREREFVVGVVRDVSRLVAGEVDALAGGALLRTWRSLHRFMAILMLLAVAIHIGVAWHYGYRWIFSG